MGEYHPLTGRRHRCWIGPEDRGTTAEGGALHVQVTSAEEHLNRHRELEILDRIGEASGREEQSSLTFDLH